MQGQIVRGVAGRREEYRPIVSQLVDSAEPTDIANAFCMQFGFKELYLADLDAIQQKAAQFEIYRRLQALDVGLWIDAGLRTPDDSPFLALMGLNAAHLIVGLESVAGPGPLGEMIKRGGSERVVFSLDMKANKPLIQSVAWRTIQPFDIAEQAIELGIRRMIVLDLANVGVSAGVGTEGLCARLRQNYPELQLIAGGGVRDINDVKRLTDCGVDYVLVASALHDGRITVGDVKRL
jgi:phosphoribosylformimino-5-aminoimidazole carboxamide ribotide isomerase